jgi:hypothetical protein
MLAGCGGVKPLTKNEPILSTASAKSPKDFAQCVHSRWTEINAHVDSSQKSESYSVFLPDVSEGMIVLMVAKPLGIGTEAKVYERTGVVGMDQFKVAAQRCI